MRQRYFLKKCLLFKEEGDFIETSAFGIRIHPITKEKRVHNGVDGTLWIGECKEATILAIADGEVIHVEADVEGFSKERPAGNNVWIDHGNGYVSKYFHFEYGTVKVNVGNHVSREQELGYMGKTGLSTGEHIHFQLEYKGKPIDPRGLIITGSFCKTKHWIVLAKLWVLKLLKIGIIK